MATRYGFLSTHPPTCCGLATFNAALAGGLIAGGASGGVVRVTSPGDDLAARPGVAHTWPARQEGGWRDAADALNVFDIAIIQHEYGIYPGVDGADVLRLMRRLVVPSIVVLHTVPVPADSATEIAAGADRRVRRRRSHDDRCGP